jgi:diguanylate cyclase (GGDEF)-like protein/PAS domain S-box-containing protein
MATILKAACAEGLGSDVLRQLVAACSDGVLLLDARDPELKIVYANPAYESMSGYTLDDLVGVGWRLVGPDAAPHRELERLKEAIASASDCDVILADVRKDGKSWLSRLALRPVHDADGDLQYFACLQRPIAERRGRSRHARAAKPREPGQTQRLAPLERLDAPTGLLRLEQFVAQLDRDLKIARRVNGAVTVVVFEIVELDVYRRTFGANAADSCLRMIAAQLTGAFRRAGDLCARCGAETLVASANGLDEAQAGALAKRVADKVRGLGLHNPRARSGRYLGVQSAVVAAVPGSDDAAALIETAKARLTEPKSRRAATA